MYIFYLYKIYIYTYMYLYSFLYLLKLAIKGSCLQYIKYKKNAREHHSGGFWIWIWTIFTKEEVNFLSPFLPRGSPVPPDSRVLAPWGHLGPDCHTGADWSYLVSVEGPLVIFPLKKKTKNVLIKLYWQGGWQELVQVSFQHFGTDWKGNLLNKKLTKIFILLR